MYLYRWNPKTDNIEYEWNDPSDSGSRIGEMDIRRYDVKRTRRSLALNLDFNINSTNQLYFKSLYNSRDDWENRFRMRVGSIDMDDMKDIWYPSIYIGNGLTFKSQGSFGPEPKSLDILW